MTPTLEQLEQHYGRISRGGEVVSRCKMWLPPLLEGMTVLDLGCRRGKGVYHIAERVGAQGKAIGLDWSPEFIEDARAHAAENMQLSASGEPNMEFIVGYPEQTGVPAESVDVVIMNSVFNLSYDLLAVLSEVRRVLKPGGELYFASVFANPPIPPEAKVQYLLRGNSFGCAPSSSSYLDMFACAGFAPLFRLGLDAPSKAPVDELGALAQTEFYEGVVRAFKLEDTLTPADTPMRRVTFRGGDGAPDTFELGKGIEFAAGTCAEVSSQVARALANSRYSAWFDVVEP